MNVTKTKTAVTPRYADTGSAGMDLYADTEKEWIIQPGQIQKIPTGICVEIPKNHYGLVCARSSLHKHGLIYVATAASEDEQGRPVILSLINSVGIIDSSYRGEIFLPLYNMSARPVIINGNRDAAIRTALAQLIVQPYKFEKLNEVETLTPTSRGAGGFGSSDRKPMSMSQLYALEMEEERNKQ